LTAGLLQRAKVIVVVVLRSLEHHVFEQVGKTGLARPLVLRADVVPDVDGHDWGGTVLVQDDLQPVGQLVLFEGKLRQPRSAGRLRSAYQGGGAGKSHHHDHWVSSASTIDGPVTNP